MESAQLRHYKNKLDFEMDSWDVHDALNNGESLVVVDGRSAEAHAVEHIPGSLNIPHREINADSTASLSPSLTYVCYCDGIGCNASTKTAMKLLMLGFEVRELIGGLDWWKRDGYATAGSSPQPGKQIECGC